MEPSELFRKLVSVPRKVKRSLLVEYIEVCRELYEISFFQWRIMFPSKVVNNKEVLEKIIYQRIKSLRLELASVEKISEETKA